MLAVAFTAPSSSWQNEHNYTMHRQSSSTSKAIISSSDWDTLDFMDIEKSLANPTTICLQYCIALMHKMCSKS